MHEVQEKESSDSEGIFRDLHELADKGVLKYPKDIERDAQGKPVQGVRRGEISLLSQNVSRICIYTNGRRMAHFPLPLNIQRVNSEGYGFTVYRCDLLRWELHTALALLQGDSIVRLMGGRLALVAGTHTSPWQWPQGVHGAVLVECVEQPEGMEEPLRVALTRSKVLPKILST